MRQELEAYYCWESMGCWLSRTTPYDICQNYTFIEYKISMTEFVIHITQSYSQGPRECRTMFVATIYKVLFLLAADDWFS